MPAFDARRRARDASVGDEVTRILCERLVRSELRGTLPQARGICDTAADSALSLVDARAPKLRRLLRRRAELTQQIDRLFPTEQQPETRLGIRALLGLATPQERQLRELVQSAADLLERTASDTALVGELARSFAQAGALPSLYRAGALRALFAGSDPIADVGGVLRALDSAEGNDALQTTMAGSALVLHGFHGRQDLAGLAPWLRFVFARDAALATDTISIPTVALDTRGLPRLSTLRAPFVDNDRDASYDVDDRERPRGLVRAFASTPFAVFGEPPDAPPISRDELGRLRIDGTLAHVYVELSDTPLCVLPRVLHDLASDTTMAASIPHAVRLVGTTQQGARDFGALHYSYRQLAAQHAPAAEMLHGIGAALRSPHAVPTLDMLRAVLLRNPGVVRGFVRLAERTLDEGDNFPNAHLRAGHSFWDDMIAHGETAVRSPEMISEVLRVVETPGFVAAARDLADLMRYRDVVNYNPAAPNGPPIGFPLSRRVDLNAADTRQNTSLFEQLGVAFRAVNGMRVCNKDGAVLRIDLGLFRARWPLIGSYRQCELIDIPNVAEAYIEAILGRYELRLEAAGANFLLRTADSLGIPVDRLLERTSGIDGLTRHPTPQALNRLVFWAFDDAPSGAVNSQFVADLFSRFVDLEGNDIINTYGGSIFAVEQMSLYRSLAPTLAVFQDPRFRTTTDGRWFLGELGNSFGSHWPSERHWLTQRRSTLTRGYAEQSNVRSYEALFAYFLDDARFMEGLVELVAALDSERIQGRRGVDVLADFAHDVVSVDAALRTTRNESNVARNDGVRVGLSPLQLLLIALRDADGLRSGTAAEPASAWLAARNRLAEYFFATSQTGTAFTDAQLVRRETIPMLRLGLTELSREISSMNDDERRRWAVGLSGRFANMVESPWFSGAARAAAQVAANGEGARALTKTIREGTTGDTARALVADLGTGLQGAPIGNFDAAANVLSVALTQNVNEAVTRNAAPNVTASAAMRALEVLRSLTSQPNSRELRHLLGRLVAPDGERVIPLERILDILITVYRSELDENAPHVPLSTNELATMMRDAASLLRSEENGVARLLSMLEARALP